MDKKFIQINIENFLITFIIYLVFFQFNTYKENYLNMNIHPLVIAIAVQSIRYGTYYGGTIVLYAFIFLMLGYYQLGYDIVLFFTVYRYYKFILMFIFIYLFLGRFKDKFDFKLNLINIDRENEREQLALAVKVNKDYEKVNRILKKRIIESKESILTLNYFEKLLKQREWENVLTYGVYILINFLHCASINVLILKNNKLFPKITVGECEYKTEIDLDSCNLEIRNAVESKKYIEYVDKKTKIRKYVDVILKNNEVFAVITIERLEYEYKDTYQVELFNIIMEKIQESFNNSLIKNNGIDLFSLDKDVKIMDSISIENIIKILKIRERQLGVKFSVFEYINNRITCEKLKHRIKNTLLENYYISIDEKLIKVIIENDASLDKVALNEYIRGILDDKKV